MRIVLATFGSLGDLHPFLALALGLRERGCQPVIATHEYYRQRIEDLGIGFAPLRPNYDPSSQELNILSMDPWRGTEVILRQGLFPHLRDTYADLKQAVAGADLLVSHAIVFPAPTVSEQLGLPWVSICLAPIALFSETDPPHAFPVPWLNSIWDISPGLNRFLIRAVRKRITQWCKPIVEFRRELGLPPRSAPALRRPAFPSPQLGNVLDCHRRAPAGLAEVPTTDRLLLPRRRQ